MTTNIDRYQLAVNKAIKDKDPSKLDIALRAKYHADRIGQPVDTSEMEFPEVLKVDSEFYTKTMVNLMLPKNSLLFKK